MSKSQSKLSYPAKDGAHCCETVSVTKKDNIVIAMEMIFIVQDC
jgi:hypothetical protein